MTGRTTCREGVRALMDYTEGMLTASRRRTLEAHVGGCGRCQRFVRSYRETPRILRTATVTTMPERLRLRLFRKIEPLTATGATRRRR